MTVFLDSSALVKRYADEDGADQVRVITEVVVICALAQVEVPAAFWRKHRLGEIDAEDARILTAQFTHDHGRPDAELVVSAIRADVLDHASSLVARHPLRAYDAVQLASAILVDEAVGGCRFGCFDLALSAAAAAEGLAAAWD